jgi:hypothetical protein
MEQQALARLEAFSTAYIVIRSCMGDFLDFEWFAWNWGLFLRFFEGRLCYHPGNWLQPGPMRRLK